MDTFALTKWYLDCIDADGRAAIVYWASVAWGGVSFTWHGITSHPLGAAPSQRSSICRAAAPAWRDGRLTWRSDALGCAVTCAPRMAPFSMPLLEGAEGVLNWSCEAGAADVRIESADHPPLVGLGYVECMSMSTPPWRLPIKQLSWGRWISTLGDRSIVWIEWRGPHPLTVVFLDGHRASNAEVANDRVVAGDAILTLSDRRTLHSRSLADLVGPITSLLPDSWRQVQDRKWLSGGRLLEGSRESGDGLAIHELVVFP
jgi:hypothetical protein